MDTFRPPTPTGPSPARRSRRGWPTDRNDPAAVAGRVAMPLAAARFGASAASPGSWSFIGRLSPLGLMVGLWSIAALLDLATAVAGPASWATLVRVSCTYAFGFAMSFATYRVGARAVADLAEFSFVRIVLIALPSGTALFFVDVFARAFAHGDSPLQAWPTAYVLRLRPIWAYFTMLFVFQSTISWLTASARALERHERLLREAELAALRLQLDPHFLFNTLTAISTLARKAAAVEAEQMIDNLSSFLRITLAVEPAALIPLAAEVDMTQSYLDIEAVRFGERLAVRYTCDPGLTDALVPSLILQPLVENAIKHAVAPSRETVLLSIAASAADEVLTMRVEDDGDRARPQTGAGTGIGLKNVAARLDALYGARAGIETLRRERGFVAIVRMPLRFDREARSL